MKYVLLVWEEVPEKTVLFLLPQDKAKEWEKFLVEAHNKLINADDMNDGLRFLNTAIASEDGTAEDGFEEYLGVLSQYKWEDNNKPILDKDIVAVYVSGFVL